MHWQHRVLPNDNDWGHLAITTSGVFARDQMVLQACQRAGVSIAAVIGGGYQRDIKALVDAHLQLFKAAGLTNKKQKIAVHQVDS